MNESPVAAIAAWSGFYTMVGSAAAALTGLMFVVIGLVMGWTRHRRSQDGLSVFSTPTVVHFGATLLVATILLAPWRSVAPPAVLVVLTGALGVGYMLRLIYRTRNLASYRADLDDWAWYNILPFVAYGALCIGGVWALTSIERSLFVVAGAAVLLMFIGIRNAWDIVTFIAVSEE
ncbi:MAG TPA: hypothetical protein VFE16_07280 [Candidatus Cybelea sp.]|jgi:hypothetical protein|nr:hypothetical protein [Candidatus Cybelea sp.]